MSELDVLKSNINEFGGLCRGMVAAGNLGMTYSSTIERLEKSSLDIIAGLEKAKATPSPPPKVEIPVEPPKVEETPATPKKRKKVRKYG